jgi:hypothetical protein
MAADAHREVSGAQDGPRIKAASSLPLVLAAAGVVAMMVGGIWWTNRPSEVPAAAPETVLMRAGADSIEGQSLPPQRPMTRADSLAIAAALHDELARIDPEAARAAPVAGSPEPGSGTIVVSLDRQLALADSLVRVRLTELTSRSAEVQAMAERSVARGTSSIGPVPGTARKTVMVVATGSRDRSADLQQLSQAIVAEITARLARGGQWEVVAPERVTGDEEALPAEVLVTVSASRAGQDSATARIGVRNLTPGSQFGYNVVSSKAFALADGARGYRATVGQAYEVLSDLRRLDRGQSWNFDMGRTGVRVFTPEQQRRLDSLRGSVPRPPGTPEPMPSEGP